MAGVGELPGGGGCFTAMVLMVFSLAGTRLALPADAVAEVVLEPRLVRPPGMPAALAGVMDWRGVLVPVVRLGRLFGLPDIPGAFRKLVVLRRPPPMAPWAVLVDDIAEVVAVADDAMLPPPPEVGGSVPCVTAMVGDLAVLSPDCLLDRREAEAVADLRDRAAERWKEFALGDE